MKLLTIGSYPSIRLDKNFHMIHVPISGQFPHSFATCNLIPSVDQLRTPSYWGKGQLRASLQPRARCFDSSLA
ncbi:FsC-acetyl coenzyme A-N(2)-transacetylase [Fusarium oxysporum f. sp. albedinis]|nr:FsC-acetyl coenzyme A-N(2)-transacetylase [Fusarium oxysporum f. sp. albedinis]